MSEFKQDLVAQKVEVLQKELTELQSVLQAVTVTYSTALKVMLDRLDKLEIRNAQADAAHKMQIAGLPEEHKDLESGTGYQATPTSGKEL